MRIKGETLGVVWGGVFSFFPNAFRMGIEGGFHRASRSIAGRLGGMADSARLEKCHQGFYSRLAIQRREFSPNPTASESHGVHAVFNFHATEKHGSTHRDGAIT